MRALVTGAAGFVGSNLCRRLIASGHDVVGIDAFTSYYSEAIKRNNAASLTATNFTLHDGDLLDSDLKSLLDGVDVVFHQAGQPGVRASWGADFATYTRNNVLATQRLLEAAKGINLKKFVYASSSSVYGDAERFPTVESDLPKPVSPYGVTKLAAEHLVTLYGTNFGVPTLSLRYFTVYGPGQRPDMAFTRFAQAAVSDREIRIFGTGEQVRDFTYIDDIVDANLSAADASEVSPGEIVNVSGGTSISVNGTLNILSRLAGKDLRVSYVGRADGDVRRTGGSSERARTLLGWQSKVSIETGLERQLAWARDTMELWRSLPQNTV